MEFLTNLMRSLPIALPIVALLTQISLLRDSSRTALVDPIEALHPKQSLSLSKKIKFSFFLRRYYFTILKII